MTRATPNVLPPVAGTLMLAAFACGALLHVDRAPPWSLAVALLAMAWQLLWQRGRLALPGTLPRVFITLGLLLATAASYRTVAGLSAGSTLLLVMGGAKLLEIRQPRDARVIALVALALLLAAGLDRQSLPRIPLYLATGWIALAAMTALGGSAGSIGVGRTLGIAGRALLYALPLAVLCFVFVPRMPGALWSFSPGGNANTGLGDEMSPGSITELSNSDDVVFRIRFDGAPPPLAQRYWRGPVLHDFDGFTWRRRRAQAVRQPAEPASPAVRYQITLEPTGQNFLFGLDSIEQLSERRSLLLFDGQVISTRPITASLSYTGVSHLQVRATAPLSFTGRRLDTQLPAEGNPRTRALAQRLRAEAADDRQYTRRVLRYFHDSGLRYTLTPPLLNRDSVDDLLFNTRLGFCGHFASAYVTMMRAVGIPARVVTGYLGGTWNSIGGYYVVRQYDAHAWAEVWLDDSGWVRIDPTAVVEPERLQNSLPEIMGADASATQRLLIRAPWLRNLRDGWDAAANWWQERVVHYNLAMQTGLLERLGIGWADYRTLALILLAGATLWMAWIWMSATGRKSARPDALGSLWLAFIDLLQRRGLVIAAHEGPRAIARRAEQQFPALASHIGAFTEGYMQGRFGADSPAPAALSAMRRQLHSMTRASRGARRSPARGSSAR